MYLHRSSSLQTNRKYAIFYKQSPLHKQSPNNNFCAANPNNMALTLILPNLIGCSKKKTKKPQESYLLLAVFGFPYVAEGFVILTLMFTKNWMIKVMVITIYKVMNTTQIHMYYRLKKESVWQCINICNDLAATSKFYLYICLRRFNWFDITI